MSLESLTKANTINLPSRYIWVLGSRRRYEALVKVLTDYQSQGIKSPETIKNIVDRIDRLYNEMNASYGNTWRPFKKLKVVKESRKKLREDDIVGPYLITAEMYLKNKLI